MLAYRMRLELLCFLKYRNIYILPKMITNGLILEFRVSIELYWGLLSDTSIGYENSNAIFLLGIEIWTDIRIWGIYRTVLRSTFLC